MKPYWERDNNKIYQGHALDVLRGMADESVHMCVTSPPYWGLRDYELEPQVWDGDAGCSHKWGENLLPRGQSGWHTFEHKYHSPGSHKTTIGSKLKKDTGHQQNKGHGQFCQNCGAWRGSLGLEPTPELYVEHIVQIFSEVRRVLRSDGTLWLNLGDSFWGGKGKSNQAWSTENQDRETWQKPPSQIAGRGESRPSDGKHETLKPKDLCMIPAQVALALQRPHLKCKGCNSIAHHDQWGRFPNGRLICPSCVKSKGNTIAEQGWWVRSDIIWNKPNPMPESVTDRPTKSHEFLYLLTKSHKYYYDIEAIREPYTEPLNRWGGSKLKKETLKHSKYLGMQGIGLSSALREGRGMRPNPAGRNKRSVWTIDDLTLGHWLLWYEKQPEYQVLYHRYAREMGTKDVWTIPTVPFSEAHFAVFPEKLVEPCILAGTSEKGCCMECCAPWIRVVEKKKYGRWDHGQGSNQDPSKVHRMRSDVMGKNFDDKYEAPKTVGWRPGCKCYKTDPFPEYPKQYKNETDEAYEKRIKPIRVERLKLLELWKPLPVVPGVVFDPFFGSGTTGEVAYKFGHNFTVIELSESYLKDIAVPRMDKATKQRKLF